MTDIHIIAVLAFGVGVGLVVWLLADGPALGVL